MDKNEKFFRKLSPKDRTSLQTIIELLLSGVRQGLNIKKVSGSDFWRLRKGSFRIVFHYGSGRIPIIDSVRLRNEGTYKDL